jgi:hypothetical protein
MLVGMCEVGELGCKVVNLIEAARKKENAMKKVNGEGEDFQNLDAVLCSSLDILFTNEDIAALFIALCNL